ncbi:MAG: HNH endonuclease [Bacteroidetes bacterium]|nr:HNH endonuclease [Bacteroidota bacterium]
MLSKLDSFYDWCDKNNVATEEADEEGNDADVDLSTFPVEKTSVLPAKRYQVFQRDDWKCVSCGKDPRNHSITLHIDHIIPRSKGGLDQADNYQTLCDTCNLGKGNRDNTNIRELHSSGK